MGVVIVVAGLLGLVLLLLAVPLSVDFRVDGIQPFRGQVVVRWLFGLVRTRLPFPAASRPGPDEASEPGRRSSARPAEEAQPGPERPGGAPRGRPFAGGFTASFPTSSTPSTSTGFASS